MEIYLSPQSFPPVSQRLSAPIQKRNFVSSIKLIKICRSHRRYGETAETAAICELKEETGFTAARTVEASSVLVPDAGDFDQLQRSLLNFFITRTLINDPIISLSNRWLTRHDDGEHEACGPGRGRG
jgi:hypothetical protein